MKFAIIIPTLNEEKHIAECLQALQSLRNDCVIVVADGGSKDNTRFLAEHQCDLWLTSPKGRANQMNAGARQVECDILIFLHADTTLPPDALNLVAQSINPERQWGRFDIRLTGSHRMLLVVAFFMNWRSRLTGIATGDQAIFVTKYLFDRLGQFPRIPLMEDITLCARLKQMSPPICLQAKVTSSGRRWEQFGVFKTILLMWSLRLRYFFGADPYTLVRAYQEGKLWNR